MGLSHNSDKEVDLTQVEGLYEIFTVWKPFQKVSQLWQYTALILIIKTIKQVYFFHEHTLKLLYF